jgi:preprotein translocase SecE subunit
MELAMAVAEKTIVEPAPRNPQRELAFKSCLGAFYVLASLWLVFAGMPYVWAQAFPEVHPFLAGALLLIVDAGVAAGAFFLGWYLERNAQPPHGFRAGVFAVCATVLIVVWIAHWIGTLLAEQDLGAFGMVLTLGVAAGLIFAASRLFLKPGFSSWLIHWEDQGWFHATSYKGNQGVRVRRGTMLAALVLGACGLYTMISHRALGSDLYGTGNDWELTIPFTLDGDDVAGAGAYRAIPLMYQIHYTVPVVLSLMLIWFAWRVVNWPIFADFLIATEAEMNKVSWTSRQRLFQDTIVVLVTVTLLTLFLFVVDILWIKILSSPVVQVLKVDIKAEQLKQQEKSQW